MTESQTPKPPATGVPVLRFDPAYFGPTHFHYVHPAFALCGKGRGGQLTTNDERQVTCNECLARLDRG